MSAEVRPRVLVVEDDWNASQGLVRGLSRAGFDVSVAVDGAEGANRALTEAFDLVVLDLMLPEKSGFEVLSAMAGKVSTPVIVLSARTELTARLKSFELGAVDFVSKPFWIEELIVRIRTRLSKVEEVARRTVMIGDVVLEVDGRRAVRAGEDLGLTAHEFDVLLWLVERPGRAVSRAQLADHALGEEGARAERTVDSHVSRVRKKLGQEGARIETVWGIGYRYQPETP